MTYQDWLDWKQLPMTRLFYQAVDERIEDTKELLANSAGLDPLTDSFNRGFIYAYREMKEFRVEDDDGTEVYN